MTNKYSDKYYAYVLTKKDAGGIDYDETLKTLTVEEKIIFSIIEDFTDRIL